MGLTRPSATEDPDEESDRLSHAGFGVGRGIGATNWESEFLCNSCSSATCGNVVVLVSGTSSTTEAVSTVEESSAFPSYITGGSTKLLKFSRLGSSIASTTGLLGAEAAFSSCRGPRFGVPDWTPCHISTLSETEASGARLRGESSRAAFWLCSTEARKALASALSKRYFIRTAITH